MVEFHPVFYHKTLSYVVGYDRGQKHLSTKTFTIAVYGCRRNAYIAAKEFAIEKNPYFNKGKDTY